MTYPKVTYVGLAHPCADGIVRLGAAAGRSDESACLGRPLAFGHATRGSGRATGLTGLTAVRSEPDTSEES